MRDKTTIRFCGATYTLEALDPDEFEELYDSVIEHGAYLVEVAETWPLQVYWERKDKHQMLLAENSLQLEVLEKEDNRRKALRRVAA
jgi:hypothetical protein